MIAHENRVIVGAMVLTATALAVFLAAESWLGFRLADVPLVGFLLVVVVSIGLPQCYLARTDSTVEPRRRLRFVVLMTMLFAGVSIDRLDEPQHRIVVLIAGGAFLTLVGYELYAGYREASAESRSKTH